MRLNDDLSVTAVVHADAMDWVPSPAKGVERRMARQRALEAFKRIKKG